MKPIIHRLFLSCLKATELIEKRMHFRLSFRERLQLRMHTAMCSACTRYEKQSTFLEMGISMDKEVTYTPEEIKELKLVISRKLSEL